MKLNPNPKLEQSVQNTRNGLRSDRLDMSFGEIMSLYEDRELDITPEYQRAFRWSEEQQTGFIESILLNIPIPPIFVAEDSESKWELVDGVQRISTILSFFGKLSNGKHSLTLLKGDLIPELKGISIQNIPIKLQNTLKRATCRVEILRWDGSLDMRFELFKRLNTTASPLSEQEIRNCIFRSSGNNFNQLLKDITSEKKFKDLTNPTKKQKDEMYCEELVLRFFCFQHNYKVKESLPNHLTQFMEKVTKRDIPFDINENKAKFMEILNNISYESLRNKGALSLKLWDSILFLTAKHGKLKPDIIEKVKNEINETDLRKKTGRDRPKIAIEIALSVFEENNVRS